MVTNPSGSSPVRGTTPFSHEIDSSYGIQIVQHLYMGM